MTSTVSVRRTTPGVLVRAAVLLIGGALSLAILVVNAQRGAPALGTVLQILVGLSFVACGVLLWTRRPANRLGLLMTTVGLLWLVGRTLFLVQIPVVFTAGMWLSDLWAAAFALLLLSFPAGRLASRADRAIVGIFLFVSIPLEFVWLLFFVPENGMNVLAVAPNESAAQVIDTIQRVTLTLGAVLLVGALGLRWLRSSSPVRRQLVPAVAGAVAIMLQSVSWILEAFGVSIEPVYYLSLVALIAIPIAVVAMMLRSRLARAGVADLVVELGQTPTPSRLQEALASALGDPSLRAAWWDPTNGRFVDAAGNVLALPEEDTDQAVTMLERGGVPEAAIIHDAALLEDPGLMASVASAMRLAVANDRLTTEREAQLEEVRASRTRIVEAGDRERRRVERDLHDGAQQRLVSLSLELQVARRALGDSADPAVLHSLERATDEAKAALAELRDLALGIHPLILTESGLGAAVESLADRTSVDVDVDIGPERYQPAIEGAAYFVISESLANATKYADATKATVRVRRLDEQMSIEIVDDGVGGADPHAGSGLRGPADRLAALDGSISVVSPIGGGTRIDARIPTNLPTPDSVSTL